MAAKQSAFLRRLGRPFLFFAISGFCFHASLQAEQASSDTTDAAGTNSAIGTTEEQIARLQAEETNAFKAVLRIVNQPVQGYARTPDLRPGEYPGWFHDGAQIPNFDSVDVRQTQKFPYANYEYVVSDLNPNVVYRGADLEFNAMTKYFYTDRTVPKHRLSEAQMLEINRLYRIIGHCEGEIRRLQFQPEAEAAATGAGGSETQMDIAPGQPLAAIRGIPTEKRRLYGGIAIGGLILLVVAVRLLKGKTND